ncbi:MAG: LamG domain-containing protein [Planctomycetota bacterium]
MCKKLIYLVSFVLVLSLASSASAELVAYWTFNEDPNDSIGDLNWTLEGGADYCYSPFDSKEGSYALSLDGIDDGGFRSGVGLQIDAFTEKSVALWFKAVSTSGVQVLYEEGGATNGLAIDVNDSTIDAVVQDNHVIFATSTPFDSTEWTHVAVTYDNGLLVLYVDGAEASSVMATFDANEVSRHTDGPGIGARNNDDAYDRSDTGDYFGGRIDYVALYDHVLSADEVADLAAPPKSWSPIPVDGATNAATSVDLSWTPGVNAASHNVYLGDNLDNVNVGTEDTLQGSPAISALTVSDLAADMTYYWRVDDVNDQDPNNPKAGDVWSFAIPAQTAYDPSPADGDEFVSPVVTLSWTTGLNAESHTVYIGDNFDDVNNAAGGTAQSEPNYTPEASLAKGMVHYWRVDEFDGTDTHKGDIWSLETQPDIAITDPNLVGWWKLDGEAFDLGYVIDYSGYDHHGTLLGDPQLVEGYDGGALEFDGSDDYVSIDGYKGILGPNPFSITAWINTSDIEGTIMGWGSTAGGATRLEFRIDAHRLRCESNGNVQGDTTLPDGEWIHVAVTVKAGAIIDDPDATLYLNGQVDNRTSTGGTAALNMAAGYDVIIARRHTSGRFLNALIDDVRLYDKELTDLDIKVISGLVVSSNPDPADGAKVVDTFAILN